MPIVASQSLFSALSIGANVNAGAAEPISTGLHVAEPITAEPRFRIPHMAVDAPDRSDFSASDIAANGGAPWLMWLGKFLADRQWLALVRFTSASDAGQFVASHPEKHKVPPAAMLVASKARTAGRATCVRIPAASPQDAEPNTAQIMSLLAVPLLTDKRHIVLFYGPEQSPEQQASMAALCRWASAWLSVANPQVSVPRTDDYRQFSLAETVINAAFSHRSTEAVARAVVNATRKLCGCTRVSLAVVQKPNIESLALTSISGQASLDVRRSLPRQIAAAMKEHMRTFTPSGAFATQATSQPHAQATTMKLASDQDAHSALFVSYPCKRVANGSPAKQALTRIVMLLERPARQDFSDAQITAINAALEPSLDMLARLYDQQMSIPDRKIQQWRQLTDKRLLPALVYRHRWKYGLSLLIAGSLLIPVPHRVSAHALIEAKDLQVLTAAHDGFVSTSHVRAGDIVLKNQLLATLDTQDLELAAGKWQSESAKNAQALQQALATKDRVALGRLRADAQRIKAEQVLVGRQISRAQLRAPFDGVVLSGDLHQQLGAPVIRGETLFTVAASDEYRLVLELEENDVGLLRTGQQAKVRLSALPDATWHAAIGAVLPVAVTTPEKHVFRVPANLSEKPDSLLPGMEGIARLYVGSRSLAWVYTRGVREKLRILLWRVGIIR